MELREDAIADGEGLIAVLPQAFFNGSILERLSATGRLGGVLVLEEEGSTVITGNVGPDGGVDGRPAARGSGGGGGGGGGAGAVGNPDVKTPQVLDGRPRGDPRCTLSSCWGYRG